MQDYVDRRVALFLVVANQCDRETADLGVPHVIAAIEGGALESKGREPAFGLLRQVPKMELPFSPRVAAVLSGLGEDVCGISVDVLRTALGAAEGED